MFSEDLTELLPGGKIYFYEVGTSTPKAAFAQLDLVGPLLVTGNLSTRFSIEHPNPLVADSAARIPPVYLDGDYRIVVTDADGNEIHDLDPYSIFPGYEIVTAISNDNERIPFATLTFYKSETTELIDLGGPTNPVVADANGEFEAIDNLDDATPYRVLMHDGDGQLIYDVDPYYAPGPTTMAAGVATITPVEYFSGSKDEFAPAAATSMNLTLVNANVDPIADNAPNAVLFVQVSLFTNTITGVFAPTLTVDGTPMNVQWMIRDGGGADQHGVLAMLRIPNGGFSPGVVNVAWPSLVPAGSTVRASANVMFHVGSDSDDFALGFLAEVNVNTTVAMLNVPEGGAVFAMNLVNNGGDKDAIIYSHSLSVPNSYTMQSPQVQVSSPRYMTGYRLFADADPAEQLVSNGSDSASQFRPVIAVVLGGAAE